MSENDRIKKIKSQLIKGEFLKFRNYREENAIITERFWQLVCMILLSSRVDNKSDKYIKPKKFLQIVRDLYDRVFLDIDKSTSNIREIPRKIGLNRALWKKYKHEFNDLKAYQDREIHEVELSIHQSIIFHKEVRLFIHLKEPELITTELFDKWHKKLEQQVAPLFFKHYPPQLIEINGEAYKLKTAVYIKNELVKSYQQYTEDAIISFYIKALIDRIEWFFSEHDFNVYSEDLLTQTKD